MGSEHEVSRIWSGTHVNYAYTLNLL